VNAPTGFFSTFHNQVINQHPGKTICAGKNQGRSFLCKQASVNACYDALSRRFFIACCTIYLTCKEKALCNMTGFKENMQVVWKLSP